MRAPTHPLPAEWLMAYHDGELDAARRDRVEEHLAECAECRRALDELKALSRALASDELPKAALAGKEAFWSGVKSRLADRQPLSTRSVLLRWSPGIGLLLFNGVLQVAAATGTLLMLVPAKLWNLPDWAGWGYRLAAASSLGWLAWMVPGNWSWLGLIIWSMVLSGGLAVLYLAWLGYELRYGAPAHVGRVVAGTGG